MSDKNILTMLLGTIAVALTVMLAGWYVKSRIDTHYSPEAREKAFQSQLAECERLAELNGNDWRLKLGLDNTCVAVFEEYSRRVDEEKKQQDIDRAAAEEIAEQEAILQGLDDISTPEPPDTE